jgi:pescadillo protein
MARIQKKGAKGAAKNYVTRSQALKKLQITLGDFRRLCILKGIFPRQPRNVKKANKGSTAPASFYYAKDIAFLQHEPVLRSLREHKSFAKKLSKAVGRREWHLAKGLEDNKPVYKLDHIIKQRYPTFDDSLKDLDDALSLLMLFANLPTHHYVKPETIESCARLCAQWQIYIMQSRSLRKVFLSIKGIYFQAEIRGQTITWLVPYMFTQHIPHDIDFRIMSTFLELYQTLLGFVLFKLYTDINLVYPPVLDEDQDSKGAGLGALRLTEANKAAMDGLSGEGQGGAKGRQTLEIGDSKSKKVSAREVKKQIKAIQENGVEGEETEEVNAAPEQVQDEIDPDDFVERQSKTGESSAQLTTLAQLDATSSTSPQQTLFAPYYFFISRECPRSLLEFVLRCFGSSAAQIGWSEVSGSGAAFDEDDERITHHIIDRPSLNQSHPGKRVYVQPQWVIDCINARKVLSTTHYQPGKALPPHLSPFVDDEEVKRRGGYVPAEAGLLTAEETHEEKVEEDDDDDDESRDVVAETLGAEEQRPSMSALLLDPLNEDLLASAELEAEAQGGEEALHELQEAHQAAVKIAKKTSSGPKKAPTSKQEEDEAKNMAKMLMSNRQRKLYNKLSYSEGKRAEEKNRLQDKKRQLNKKKSKKAAV